MITKENKRPKNKKKQLGEMKIGELCKLSGLSRSTIYRYIRKGVLPSPKMEGFRSIYFTGEHLRRLKQIKFLRKEEKVNLSEIDNFFPARGLDDKNDVISSTPHNDDSELKRLQIINSAARLFSEQGFQNTRISDITDALGIGKGTFYLYFKDKRELFLECIERLTLIIIPEECWEKIRCEHDPIQRIGKRFKAFLNAFPNFIGIFSFVKASLFSDDESLVKKAKNVMRLLNAPVIKDINWAIKHGIFRDVDGEIYAFFFLGMMEMFGYRMVLDPKYTIDDGVKAGIDLISRLLLKQGDISNQKKYALRKRAME